MRHHRIPTNHMVFKEILTALTGSRLLRLADLSNLSRDVLDYNDSFLQLHHNDCISTYINEDTFREHLISVDLGRYINFLFTYTGGNLLTLKDRVSFTRGVDVVTVINAKAYALNQKSGESKKAISFMVTPPVLIEEYGLRVDALPPHVAAALRGIDPRPLILELSLPPRVRVALEGVYETGMTGGLLAKFVYAKAEELICETVHMLNARFASHAAGPPVSPEERLRQKIESAAYLYRQSIGRHPSIAEMCRRIGVNRNILNSGFKAYLGQSPAEYARTQTLEWARRQLLAGQHSVKSISDVAGYANVSAFSRAYGAQFGSPPAQSRRVATEPMTEQDRDGDGSSQDDVGDGAIQPGSPPRPDGG